MLQRPTTFLLRQNPWEAALGSDSSQAGCVVPAHLLAVVKGGFFALTLLVSPQSQEVPASYTSGLGIGSDHLHVWPAQHMHLSPVCFFSHHVLHTSCAVPCCAALCCAVLCCAVLCCAVLCCCCAVKQQHMSPSDTAGNHHITQKQDVQKAS